MAPYVIVRSVPGQRFSQKIESGRHQLSADKQISFGGSDQGPGPYAFLLAALGSWISITLRMYAERKGLALQSVEVQLSHERVYAEDCEDCETKDVMLDEIRSQIHLEGNLNETERNRLLEIATRCPVHRTLAAQINIRSELM